MKQLDIDMSLSIWKLEKDILGVISHEIENIIPYYP